MGVAATAISSRWLPGLDRVVLLNGVRSSAPLLLLPLLLSLPLLLLGVLLAVPLLFLPSKGGGGGGGEEWGGDLETAPPTPAALTPTPSTPLAVAAKRRRMSRGWPSRSLRSLPWRLASWSMSLTNLVASEPLILLVATAGDAVTATAVTVTVVAASCSILVVVEQSVEL